jgi:hypothetical protein
MAHATLLPGRTPVTISHHKTLRAILTLTILVGCAYAATASADTLDSPRFSFRGFGTLGAVRSDQDYSDVVSSTLLQPNGAGATSRWNMGVDSKIGGQLDAHFNPRLSAVVQVVSKHRYDNSWTPEIEWANVKYQITPALSVRAGRTVSSILMLSDTANVGYANPWLRGPQEVYGIAPFTHMDGIDFAWNSDVGPVVNSFQAGYGSNKFDIIEGDKVTVDNIFLASNTVEYKALALRVGYVHLDATFDTSRFPSLANRLSSLGTAFTRLGFPMQGNDAGTLAKRYDMDNIPIEGFTAGFRANPDNWRVIAEWAKKSDAGILPKMVGWYISSGYQFRQVTPYVTVARLDSKTPSESGIPLAGLPPGPLRGGAGALNAALGSALNAVAPSQKSLTLGLRWDLLDNAALKFEYQHIRLDDRSAGRFGNLQPGFRPGGDADVFSVALDFLF